MESKYESPTGLNIPYFSSYQFSQSAYTYIHIQYNSIYFIVIFYFYRNIIIHFTIIFLSQYYHIFYYNIIFKMFSYVSIQRKSAFSKLLQMCSATFFYYYSNNDLNNYLHNFRFFFCLSRFMSRLR